MGIFDRLKNLFRADKEEKNIEREKFVNDKYVEIKDVNKKIAVILKNKAPSEEIEMTPEIEKLLQRNLELGQEIEDLPEHQESLKIAQNFVDNLFLKIADFWGIPKDNIKDKIPRIVIGAPFGGCYYDQNDNTINIQGSEFDNPSALFGPKAALAEEVGHSIVNLIKPDTSVKEHEFFAAVSRYFIAKQYPGAFKKEYSELLKKSVDYEKTEKELEEEAKSLDKKIESLPDGDEKDKLFEKREEVQQRLDHILYYPAAYLVLKFEKMKPEEKYELLKDPSKIKNLVENEASEGLKELKEKMNERETLKEKLIEEMKKYPVTKQFFQKVAEEAGKAEYGRGMKNLDEVANELSDIKSEEQSLQELAKKLTLQLAEFWGIPSSLQIQAFVPTVKICDKENYKELVGDKDVDIEKEVPKAYYFKSKWGMTYSHYIVVNRDWLSNEFSEGLMHSIKSSLAEEVGHFIQDAVGEKTGKPDEFVREFFGMISRLYIAEQIPELFKGEYHNLFNNSIEFSTRFETIKNLIRYYESQPNNPQVGSQGVGNSDKISELKDALDHLAYAPAVSYYYEIRKMSSQERYKLLNMSFTDLKNYIIGPQIRKLEEIRLKVMQRRQVAADRERNLQSYPATSQFYQNVAAESGRTEYGRETEPEQYQEEPEEEYQEVEEQGEYENVPPPLPKIVINIPNKIPKDLAKKLESKGIKIPKDKIK